ncbi:MAG TPA: tetratricopeptide repeat protein [Candidatus Ozemobacteraceae bacterium]|nr:tetratricopeptide repeat protein [Candidatus Ozemobacteraceae bacterium]
MIETQPFTGSDGQKFYQQGLACDAEGKVQEAIEAYREALRVNPHMAEAYYSLGFDLALVEDRIGAVRMWRKAIWLNADYQRQLISALDLDHELREVEVVPVKTSFSGQEHVKEHRS